MKDWKIIYTKDNGNTYQAMTVKGKDYTKAYIDAVLKISKDGIITACRQIPKAKRNKNKKYILKHVF